MKMVRKERLELSRVAPLEPKSSASTNSATFADTVPVFWLQRIRHERIGPMNKPASGQAAGRFLNMGWTMGIEPTTTRATILCSTN